MVNKINTEFRNKLTNFLKGKGYEIERKTNVYINFQKKTKYLTYKLELRLYNTKLLSYSSINLTEFNKPTNHHITFDTFFYNLQEAEAIQGEAFNRKFYEGDEERFYEYLVKLITGLEDEFDSIETIFTKFEDEEKYPRYMFNYEIGYLNIGILCLLHERIEKGVKHLNQFIQKMNEYDKEEIAKRGVDVIRIEKAKKLLEMAEEESREKLKEGVRMLINQMNDEISKV